MAEGGAAAPAPKQAPKQAPPPPQQQQQQHAGFAALEALLLKQPFVAGFQPTRKDVEEAGRAQQAALASKDFPSIHRWLRAVCELTEGEKAAL